MEPGPGEADQHHVSASPPPTMADPTAAIPQSKPPTAIDSNPEKRTVEHDSMVTVRLSEPPALTINTNVTSSSASFSSSSRSLLGNDYRPTNAMAETVKEEDGSSEEPAGQLPPQPPRNLQDELQQEGVHNNDEEDEYDDKSATSIASTPASDIDEVDWEQLQKTENEQSSSSPGQDTDNTVMLLAKLEQENAKLATNPKSIKTNETETPQSPTNRPSPPSMAQLKDMVHGPTPTVLRYSVLPPPPMTDLEFYAALVKDYRQTAARLPTLLSNKIRKGVPPPLRGVVWQSMSVARDSALEEQFERFSGESSPYEGLIGKDLGRSFPGVDMFRDPEGDGQRMLGRVLKCYSLHDPKIGYCQGLAFLVGPLLMHMPDKQAFCVLVKLMENYDLRNSYTPDLSGLHVRIYQFGELLRQHLPLLSSHLDDLQVEPAYVSQWFLSFFAVTCPLPMLFRIFDVIFAEGASETIMRVALSLMQKNQGRILACTEMEDVMQLLLSRGLWDCYHYNADELVDDFTSLAHVVSRERLAALEQGYREAQIASGSGTNAAHTSDVTTAASRFLGRLWVSTSPTTASFNLKSSAVAAAAAAASSKNNNKNTNKSSNTKSSSTSSSSSSSSSTLSPGLAAPLRPLSMLRRSTSKQSLASTLNSMEAGSSSSSVLSSASTEATSLSRDSSASDGVAKSSAAAGAGSGTSNNNNSDTRYLHNQIEDLLTALSDLQRQHALLADQLQREREERAEDQKAVRSLVNGLRGKEGRPALATAGTGGSNETIKNTSGGSGGVQLIFNESPAATAPSGGSSVDGQLSVLLEAVEQRLGEETGDRRSSIPQTKSQLRDELARAKEQLANELAKGQDCSRRLHDMEQETTTLKDQLRESHAHARSLHQDKQRLEKQIHTMKGRATSGENVPTIGIVEAATDWFGRSNTFGPSSSTTSLSATGGGAAGGSGNSSSTGGLRELKLGRSRSTPSQASNGPSPFGKRASSLMVRGGRESMAGPTSEHDALLLELVQAKTAEAVARQEADEAKQKLETLRKAFGLALGDTPPASHNSTMASAAASQASAAASAAMGMIGRFTNSVSESSSASKTGATALPAGAATATTTAGSTTSGYGGFFGWRRS